MIPNYLFSLIIHSTILVSGWQSLRGLAAQHGKSLSAGTFVVHKGSATIVLIQEIERRVHDMARQEAGRESSL